MSIPPMPRVVVDQKGKPLALTYGEMHVDLTSGFGRGMQLVAISRFYYSVLWIWLIIGSIDVITRIVKAFS